MDLVVNIPGEVQVLCDVTVVSPSEWDPGPCHDALRAAEQRKIREYGESATRSGKVFVPLAIEHGGRRGPQFQRFFEETINRYSVNTGGDREAAKGYWNRRLAIALQRGLAHATVLRAHRVACRAFAANIAADSEIALTEPGHSALGTAPSNALDPLQDRLWDYPGQSGAGAEGWVCQPD